MKSEDIAKAATFPLGVAAFALYGRAGYAGDLVAAGLLLGGLFDLAILTERKRTLRSIIEHAYLLAYAALTFLAAFAWGLYPLLVNAGFPVSIRFEYPIELTSRAAAVTYAVWVSHLAAWWVFTREHREPIEEEDDQPIVKPASSAPPKHGGGIRGLTDLEVGKTGTGEPLYMSFWVPKLGTRPHLIVGATGAGKGSAIWAPLTALKPALMDGTVVVIGIDPKEAEFGHAPGIFTDLVTGQGKEDIERAAQLLEREVALMSEHQKWMKQNRKRLHVPTVERPMHLIVIDELMAITYLIRRTHPTAYNRIIASLITLQSQGRACGWGVVAATQNPKAEVMDMLRDGFSSAVCLRVTQATHVDMALGWNARASGALADKIPEHGQQGVGYVIYNGDPLKIRYRWVDDDELAAFGEAFIDGKPRTQVVVGGAPIVGERPDYGPAIEVGTPSEEPQMSVPELLLATWPKYRGEPNKFDHLDNLAQRLGMTASDLAEYVAEAGVPVIRGSARPLAGGPATTKDGLSRGAVEAWSRSGAALHGALHAREGVDLRR